MNVTKYTNDIQFSYNHFEVFSVITTVTAVTTTTAATEVRCEILSLSSLVFYFSLFFSSVHRKNYLYYVCYDIIRKEY